MESERSIETLVDELVASPGPLLAQEIFWDGSDLQRAPVLLLLLKRPQSTDDYNALARAIVSILAETAYAGTLALRAALVQPRINFNVRLESEPARQSSTDSSSKPS